MSDANSTPAELPQDVVQRAAQRTVWMLRNYVDNRLVPPSASAEDVDGAARLILEAALHMLAPEPDVGGRPPFDWIALTSQPLERLIRDAHMKRIGSRGRLSWNRACLAALSPLVGAVVSQDQLRAHAARLAEQLRKHPHFNGVPPDKNRAQKDARGEPYSLHGEYRKPPSV